MVMMMNMVSMWYARAERPNQLIYNVTQNHLHRLFPIAKQHLLYLPWKQQRRTLSIRIGSIGFSLFRFDYSCSCLLMFVCSFVQLCCSSLCQSIPFWLSFKRLRVIIPVFINIFYFYNSQWSGCAIYHSFCFSFRRLYEIRLNRKGCMFVYKSLRIYGIKSNSS